MENSLTNNDFVLKLPTGQKKIRRECNNFSYHHNYYPYKTDFYKKNSTINTTFPIVKINGKTDNICIYECENISDQKKYGPIEPYYFQIPITNNFIKLEIDSKLKLPYLNVTNLKIPDTEIIANTIYLHMIFDIKDKNESGIMFPYYIKDELIIGKTIDENYFIYNKKLLFSYTKINLTGGVKNHTDFEERYLIKPTFDEITKSGFITDYKSEINTFLQTINNKIHKDLCKYVIEIRNKKTEKLKITYNVHSV
jgi:hypothetical protein